MSVLPAVRDAAEAAELVRELFHNPPPAARELATPADVSPFEAAMRYLRVALNDLPPEQAALLRDGMAALLGERELTAYLVVLLEDGGAAAAQSAAALVTAGDLRGVAVIAGRDGDLHALLLGLCGRLSAHVPAAALARDAADPRYRDLAVFLLAGADLAELAVALPAVASTLASEDEYAIEALGRALREALHTHGAIALLKALPAGEPDLAPVLLTALREAITPARVAFLSPAQQEQRLAALRRMLVEHPDDDAARLSLDAEAGAAFLVQCRARLEGKQ